MRGSALGAGSRGDRRRIQQRRKTYSLQRLARINNGSMWHRLASSRHGGARRRRSTIAQHLEERRGMRDCYVMVTVMLLSLIVLAIVASVMD